MYGSIFDLTKVPFSSQRKKNNIFDHMKVKLFSGQCGVVILVYSGSSR
jgi:hypothetical protein